ncbi:hypothetical protein GCM10012280_15600 [Wenjunlia tyrosinilytica]|jgi:hypothetical protein|uniref:Uncharacterized protein n=1 Tax=Wenjunlia tyrosinilytica TaxID=1544741 RepID=A0A918DUZ5_9ACTN|nr:hypothetical protein GCM10012280_15600 [Wenjunlia tyrosinilytica]
MPGKSLPSRIRTPSTAGRGGSAAGKGAFRSMEAVSAVVAFHGPSDPGRGVGEAAVGDCL